MITEPRTFSSCPDYTSGSDKKLGFESELQGLPWKEWRFEFKDRLGNSVRIRTWRSRWVPRTIGAGERYQNQ